MEDEKREFWRQWAIAGMPKDKQRLAEAAWDAAVMASANYADDHGLISDAELHEHCQGCGEAIAEGLRAMRSNDLLSRVPAERGDSNEN